MAKSFFTDSKGNWRGESKRTTLWWGMLAAGVGFGGVIGSLIPVPVVGTLLGMAIGAYISSIIHHKVCENALKDEIDPVMQNTNGVASMTAKAKGFFAGLKAVFSGKSDDEVVEEAVASHARTTNRHWFKSTFWTGPVRQADKAVEETGDFFKKKLHI